MKNHHHNGPIHSVSPNDRIAIHEAIAVRAHALWERDGKPDNQAETIWLMAEEELIMGHRKEKPDSVLPISF